MYILEFYFLKPFLCILREYKGKRTIHLTGNNSIEVELIRMWKLTFGLLQREAAPDCSADWRKQFLLWELRAHTAETWFRLAPRQAFNSEDRKSPRTEVWGEHPHYYRILKSRFHQHLFRTVETELILFQDRGKDWRGFWGLPVFSLAGGLFHGNSLSCQSQPCSTQTVCIWRQECPRDARLDTGLTSKAAEMILAFLLSTDPTALKFLSRISAYSSSAEFSWSFLGSVGRSFPPSPCFFGANFSGGSFT